MFVLVRNNVQLKEGVKAFWKILCGLWTRPYFRFKYILERQIAAFTAWCTMGSNPFYWNILISIQASIYKRYFSNIPTYFDRRKNWRNCCEKGCCTKCSAHLTYNIEHTVQNGRVILDKLPSTFDTWFGGYILWIFINNN